MERFHYNIKQKLQILDMVRAGQIFRLNVQFPKVTQKMIDEWSAKEQEMRALPEDVQQTKFSLHPGPQIKYKELNQFLFQVFKSLRSERKAVTPDYLLYIAEEEEPSLMQLTVKGRRSFIERFMKYYNLSIREVTGYSGYQQDQLPEEEKTTIENFKRKYRETIINKRIPIENVFNMDQTGVNYENPTSRTIDFAGSREVCVQTQGDEKKRVTLFSLMNAKGDLETQMIVYKGVRDARIHSEVVNYDEFETRHTVQENAWCDGFVLLEWLYQVWYPRARLWQGPKLLLLDSYPLHKDFEAKFSLYDTEVLYIPTGLTWTLQPLDTGFHKILKDELKKKWIRTQFDASLSEKDKRRVLSETLKEIHEKLSMNDNTVFWDKAGLKYPVEEFNNIQSQSERDDFMEIIDSQDNMTNSNHSQARVVMMNSQDEPMNIEEEGSSDLNLFNYNT